MNLVTQYKSYIRKENLFQPTDKLLLAVSGGVDSVVLCELCKQAGYDFVIAHCNFQLRGEESERDEQFVRKLGEKYGVEVRVKQFDTAGYASANKRNIQVAARELRYNWFAEILQDSGNTLRHILTAHHLDDNIETLLMNFFKGTGILGLRGILPKQGRIIRPLLFARKEEILAFASEQGLAYAADSSNASDKYTRNYFRNKLIPGIKEAFPQAEENLIHNLQRFREAGELYQQAIDLHKKKLLEKKGAEFHIPVLKLQKAKPLHTILYEIIRDFGFTPQQVADVAGLLESDSGKYVQSATHRVIRNRKWLLIVPHPSVSAKHVLIEQEGKIGFAGGELRIKRLPVTNGFTVQSVTDIAQLDADAIGFPLLLRPWKTGDYFYPLGMPRKKKKLSRFLIDQKISIAQKEQVWVLETDKKIIWVLGMRIDDRFKITGSTKNILEISYSRNE